MPLPVQFGCIRPSWPVSFSQHVYSIRKIIFYSTVYVAESFGSDETGDGSEDHPFKTAIAAGKKVILIKNNNPQADFRWFRFVESEVSASLGNSQKYSTTLQPLHSSLMYTEKSLLFLLKEYIQISK